jgi:hypothetical protein
LGRKLYRKGQPIHARAMCEQFFNKLNEKQLEALADTVRQLEPKAVAANSVQENSKPR